MILEVSVKILKVPAESIGMHDSLFHLGGDSILAVQFVYEARRHRMAFRVVDVFQHPRLTELAALTSLKQDLPESIDAGPAEALLPASISAEDALKTFSASSQQNLTLDNIQAILLATVGQFIRLHEPCHPFIHEIVGSVNPDQLEIACQGLVQRHEILRTIFQHNSTWVQIVLKQLDLQLVRHEAQCMSLSVVKELCAADDIRIPPVNCSPVAQFSYIRGPGQISYLIIRLSHALYDGSSWRILYRDLEHLYGNLPLGDPVPYSNFIRQWAKAQAHSEALNFWCDYLDGFQMSHIGDTNNSHAVKPLQPHTVAVEKTIPGFDPPVNITQATIGKTAWALTLARFSNTPNDITFGLTTSGRNFDPLATSEIFGFCINQVPVRVRLDPDSAVLDLMQSIQHQYAESMEFELVEFGNMVPGDIDPEPVFGSALTFQNTRGRVSPLQLGTATGSWIRPTSIPNLNRRPVGVELVPIENELEIFVAAPNTIWTPERANEVHRVLYDLIPLLAKNAHLSLRDLGF